MSNAFQWGASFIDSPKPQLLANRRILPPPCYLDDLVHVLANKHGVEKGVIKSIIAAESEFHNEAVSYKGAMGLMQLMPDTARELGMDPRVPEQNLEGGTLYLSQLMRRYSKYSDQVERAIAAYNAGPAKVDKYNGIPPFPETQCYVKRVMTYYRQYSQSSRDSGWKATKVLRPRTEYGD